MANIRDIAQMAGVSVTTVSRVINNHPYVSEEKREAVIQAMEKVNYQVNRTAVNLSQGKTHLIGVVVPFARHPYFGLLIEGVAKQAMERHYHFVLIQTNYEGSREWEALNMLKHKQIDALIICSRTLALDEIERYQQYGAIVVCENATGNQYVDSVYIDHYQSFTDALTYLHQHGYQQIGYCIGRQSGSNSYFRHQAYQDFLKRYPQQEFIFTDNYYFEDGQKIVDEIMQLRVKPDALLVSCDIVAAGIFTAVQNIGIEIPNDLALIGFDNQPMSKMMGITTFEVPIVTMGERLFIHALGEAETSHEKLAVTLIERKTV
ncbi:LacI family DNA-binding transcriptional regulator [Gracilibacillus sp. S3-1-1]|uniref:LacI family DNA-binding transcriptional regulator n=1 Tax=Gracilibacillus pellucidus TaxID=3095368 RepID=A0ACC6M777_9BACI|nr:LacI family DNA-binding transcriptional regulator [Gracilibacillus sp. S3-1-1]MDX8046748.1 LacI family DNA-binding transcriptional regulator [Gracilibacillus sp. S3-1-1]